MNCYLHDAGAPTWQHHRLPTEIHALPTSEAGHCGTEHVCHSWLMLLFRVAFVQIWICVFPIHQCPIQTAANPKRISESKLVFWLIMSPRDSSQHKHLDKNAARVTNLYMHILPGGTRDTYNQNALEDNVILPGLSFKVGKS